MNLIYPWRMYGEFADGFGKYVDGFDEEDCMGKLIDIHNEGKHGDLVYYTGVNDDHYVDGERIVED